jgi:flavin-dependent dehydrogenase
MRYAMLSGHLAARALLDGRPADYDRLLSDRLGGLMKASVVNRYFYDKLGDGGYVRLSRRVDRTTDVRDWLRRSYGPGWLRSLFYPIARRRLVRDALIVSCVEGCDCTWCRCRGHGAAVSTEST